MGCPMVRPIAAPSRLASSKPERKLVIVDRNAPHRLLLRRPSLCAAFHHSDGRGSKGIGPVKKVPDQQAQK